MERDTSRVYDVITTRLTMTYPACRSQHRRSVETNEQTAARLSAQRDYARRQCSCETLEQAYVDGLLIAVGHIIIRFITQRMQPHTYTMH